MRLDELEGSAIFLAPVLLLMMAYLSAFLVNIGDAITKADGLDQSLSLAAAAASTQVSAQSFYEDGVIVLNPSDSTKVADLQIASTIPAGTTLVGSPSVITVGGGVCVRATELIELPFKLVPGLGSSISYSDSSSAIARGSGTRSAPTC